MSAAPKVGGERRTMAPADDVDGATLALCGTKFNYRSSVLERHGSGGGGRSVRPVATVLCRQNL